MAKPKTKAKSSRKKTKKPQKKPQSSGFLKRLILKVGLLLIVVIAVYVFYLDHVVRTQFEGKRWALPAHVFANPVELYQGLSLSAQQFESLLKDLHYQRTSTFTSGGQYYQSGSTFTVKTRSFKFFDDREVSKTVKIYFRSDHISAIQNVQTGKSEALLRLDPVRVGSFYPSHKEDRILIKLDDVPRTLIDGLISVEDRDFYQHYGVSIKSILRAVWANIKAGGVVQGGSTLTQQLIKNFYLTSERSLWRKIKEAMMALIIEFHYEKDEILEAYLNEVFVGQDGERSINGFGMASVFYFNKPLIELKPHQTALLVGLVKGPSYYDPRRHPERALKRRNLVLDEMTRFGVLPDEQRRIAKQFGVDISPFKQVKSSRFPAFLDLVKRQLSRDYKDEDLRSEGLNIFSTLDYNIQTTAEKLFKQKLEALNRQYGIEKNKLQGAMVITRREGGEIVAVIGDRNPLFSGFNRALDAIRPIGSLVKPAVYLTALSQPADYTLTTMIEDKAVSLKQRSGELWMPENYDKVEHGPVPLYEALSNSYNLATVRLGMALKVPNVKRTIEELGIRRPIKPYPSLLLGALRLSPLEVTQMYQTLAGEGFFTQLRSIQSVTSSDHIALQRYALSVRQVANPSAVYLVNTALQEVMTKGTGRSVYRQMPHYYKVAGKTGTTDELRDSWFAGFSGDYLAVVWLGRDDNRPSKLTGASGALQVWSSVMSTISKEPVELTKPQNVEYTWVDPLGYRANEFCEDAVQYPFIKGSEPTEYSPCVGAVNRTLERAGNWFDRLTNGM
ncbi:MULTISPECIES: penicillin-binding protein 1B [Cycloclasticus]|uniref:Penicillin-binding protein 1B n=1 Tax=Cycloclasticus zancles 78-ME TaxID=1198232 RepID=S5T8U4_9GAMM|nr:MULTISPECIES: penicillin-binding protein 1B [Cycloclasticus]AFT66771.1 Bifunctional protein penicillin-insensitive transglycosylase / penicillin-sensitive transpeptidase (Penicillin-binding protein 1B) [Cycloclasticus sp. P1]AGS40176.1 Penicillin-binding protein 1B [Cycloclasticus zancles 78-ME]MBV1898276.1 penicillin-binding protein 1B [Cycloclasticus sp.]